jgi:hypothetical protein
MRAWISFSEGSKSKVSNSFDIEKAKQEVRNGHFWKSIGLNTFSYSPEDLLINKPTKWVQQAYSDLWVPDAINATWECAPHGIIHPNQRIKVDSLSMGAIVDIPLIVDTFKEPEDYDNSLLQHQNDPPKEHSCPDSPFKWHIWQATVGTPTQKSYSCSFCGKHSGMEQPPGFYDSNFSTTIDTMAFVAPKQKGWFMEEKTSDYIVSFSAVVKSP